MFTKAEQNARWRERARRLGLCYQCMQPTWLGTSLCQRHLFKNRVSARLWAGTQAWKPGCPGHNPPVEVKAKLSNVGFV